MINVFDTSNAPTTEPVEITAGDYTVWKRTDLATVYPVAEYNLSYECRSEGVPARLISIAAVADGDDYLVTLASSVTLQYLVANYHWTAFITRKSDAERSSVDTGRFTVSADKATNSTNDPATFAQKMLNRIEEALLHRADNQQLDVLAYSLGVDSSATRDPEKLLVHRAYWQRELVKANRKARARKGLNHSAQIGVRF
jgi:hypothetical protein